MQQAKRCGAGFEHRHVELSQGEGVAFDETAVREGQAPQADGAPGETSDTSHAAEGTVATVPELKARLRTDLNSAMKARDELTTATLRMTLTAVTNDEVAGKVARELSDDEVLRVIAREAKKRREAAEAYDAAGRDELASRERAEGEVLDRYLPAQLDDDDLAALVRDAIAQAGATSPRDMGAVMRIVQPAVAGRADGKRISDEVRSQLGS
jgi:uncharacterized protein YqeY